MPANIDRPRRDRAVALAAIAVLAMDGFALARIAWRWWFGA